MVINCQFDTLQELRAFAQLIAAKETAKPEPTVGEKVKKALEQPAAAPAEKKPRGRKPVDRNRILIMKQNGATAKDIADKLGYGYSTVCRILSEVGL